MRKAGGRDELVEHVGSAHTDAELGVLLERARRIAAEGQQVLDFEVPTPVERVDDVADWRAGELVRPDRPPAGVSGAGRTVGTSSRLLSMTCSLPCMTDSASTWLAMRCSATW